MTPAADNTANHPASRWMGLAAASAGMFMGSLDISVNVALPDITRSFGTGLPTATSPFRPARAADPL